jgi:hypothetical protein
MSMACSFSVVILVIDQHGVLSFKHKGHAPVSVDPYRPVTVSQRMQPSAGNVHVARLLCLVQALKLRTQARRMMRLNASLAARAEEQLQTLVAKASDHGLIV